MGLPCYLAMTAAEFERTPRPDKVAWMACHFSAGSSGLSNLPRWLPKNSLLILDDSFPWNGHDARRIAAQLTEVLRTWDCCGLLLDFQRPGVRDVAELCGHLCRTLSCPVIVSQPYAAGLSCPILLPPLPLLQDLKSYLASWEKREIWLELSLDDMVATVTESGCTCETREGSSLPEPWFLEEELHCRYHWTFKEHGAVFTILRTCKELSPLIAEATALGVKGFVGLYQELGNEKRLA